MAFRHSGLSVTECDLPLDSGVVVTGWLASRPRPPITARCDRGRERRIPAGTRIRKLKVGKVPLDTGRNQPHTDRLAWDREVRLQGEPASGWGLGNEQEKGEEQWLQQWIRARHKRDSTSGTSLGSLADFPCRQRASLRLLRPNLGVTHLADSPTIFRC